MAEADVLVDSSIWIEGLRPRASARIQTLLKALIESNRIVVTDMVRLEVLSGARSVKEFGEFRADFEAVRCLVTTSKEWRRAEELGLVLGRRGLSVPPADTLIAAVAIEHDVPLWHADRDFERIKHVETGFRTFWSPQQVPA